MSNSKQPASPPMVLLTPCAPFTRGPQAFTRKGEALDYKTDKTIPDDSFTIKQLFDRYRAGQPFPAGLERSHSFGDTPSHSDLDMGKIRSLDLSELNGLLSRNKQGLASLEARKKELEALKEPVTPTPPAPPNPAS